MAQVILTKDWTSIDVTTGTIQNLSPVYEIEVSEDNATESGQILFPKDAMSFDGIQLYARVVSTDENAEAQVRVSPFVEAGVGGSGGSGGGGSVAPYILPTASATIKGGVKVGPTLTIDGTGVLNAVQPTPYVLPKAQKTILGGIMVGDNLTVTADGVLSATSAPYTLPTASTTEKGGVKVGSGFKMTGEVMSVDAGITAGQIVKIGTDGKIDSGILPAIATGNTFVEAAEAAMLSLSAKVGDICVRTDESKSYILQKLPATALANWIFLQSPTAAVQSVNGKTGTVTIDIPKKVSDLENDAKYISNVPPASTTVAGIVKVGDGLTIDSDGILKADAPAIPTASATVKGGVKVGDGLEMDGETLKVKPYDLPTATATELGGVKIGARLTIAADGTLSADEGGYTLPIATATELGGVKVGTNLEINADGVLTAKDQTADLAKVAKTGKYEDLETKYTLPTASNNIKGGVKIGQGLTVTNEVVAVNTATATTAGIAKLYAEKGENTDGALSQKAIKDNYLPLSGGTMTGAIEAKNVVIQNTTSTYMRIQQSADLKQGAVFDFYGRDDTNGGRVVIACGTPDGSSYKSLVVSGNGSLTFNNHNILVDNVVDGAITNVSGTIQGTCYAKKCGNLVTFYIYTSDSTSLVFAKLPWKPVSPQVFCGLMGNSTSTLQTKLIGVDADGSVRNLHDTTAWKMNIVSGCYFTND